MGERSRHVHHRLRAQEARIAALTQALGEARGSGSASQAGAVERLQTSRKGGDAHRR